MPAMFSHGWKMWMSTLSVQLPRAQNSGRQILLASKMSWVFFLPLYLKKAGSHCGCAVCCNAKSFLPKWLILPLLCLKLCAVTLWRIVCAPFRRDLDKSIDYWSKLWHSWRFFGLVWILFFCLFVFKEMQRVRTSGEKKMGWEHPAKASTRPNTTRSLLQSTMAVFLLTATMYTIQGQAHILCGI